MGRLIYHAWKNGACFDAWDDRLDMQAWTAAAQHTGITLETYAYRVRDLHEPLPWQHISLGMSHAFLAQEYQRALQQELTPDCRTAPCRRCGVCEQPGLRPVWAHQCGDDAVAVIAAAAARKTQPISYYRCTYTKKGLSRFLGHFDIGALMERACIAAGVALAYTEGFKPRPRLSFGPPLGFGIATQGDLFDIVVHGRIEDHLERINAWLPEGIAITRAERFSYKPSSINAQLVASHYRIELPSSMAADTIARRCDACMQQDELVVEIHKKKKTRHKNIRPFLEQCRPLGHSALQVIIAVHPEGTCKPVHVVQALFPGVAAHEVRITRTACVLTHGRSSQGNAGTLVS